MCIYKEKMNYPFISQIIIHGRERNKIIGRIFYNRIVTTSEDDDVD
jgi:hypothetical protein